MKMPQKINELVSIIIPTYGCGKELKRAINSVISQTYEEIEILVIDDNDPMSIGRKQTEEIMGEYQENHKVRYIKHVKNMGGAAARNTGIKKAGGIYIGFLDDDDIYLPQRVEKSVEKLQKNPKCQAVFCDLLHVLDETACSIHHMDPERVSVKGILLYEAAIGSGSNLFVKKTALEKLKGFDTDFVRHQDLEFAIRLLDSYKATFVEEVLVVKAYNGINNEPNYYKMKEVKQKFNKKFQKQIQRLSEDEQKSYYRSCYQRLFQSALAVEDYGEARRNLQLMNTYGFRSGMKQKVQLLLVKAKVFTRVKKRLHPNGVRFTSKSPVILLDELNDKLKQELKGLGISISIS